MQQDVDSQPMVEEYRTFESVTETPNAVLPPSMSPANSAALQQILEQASGVFPAQSAPGTRTTEDWQREVDELLRSMPPAQPAPNRPTDTGGRRPQER